MDGPHGIGRRRTAQATVYFGEAPTSQAACDYAETISPGHCELTHATDEAYYDKIWYWATPQADCADDRRRPRRARTRTPGSKPGRSSAVRMIRRNRSSSDTEGSPVRPGGPPSHRAVSGDRRPPPGPTPGPVRRAAPGLGRRISTWLYPRARLQAGLLLARAARLARRSPTSGALFILLLSAFWEKDAFTGNVEPFTWSLDAFEQLATTRSTGSSRSGRSGWPSSSRSRTPLLAFPIAYYMARVASPRKRGMLVVAVLMPLWAAYLVKVYAWRIVLQGNGLARVAPRARSALAAPGLGRAEQRLARLQLPVAAVHDPARSTPASSGSRTRSSRRRPTSARRPLTTFRKVVLPLVFPALVAGSIFTFSLTLGDYITPDLVADAKFIGNVIYDNSSAREPARSRPPTRCCRSRS